MGGKDGRLGSSASVAIYDHKKDEKNVRQVEHVLPQRGSQISEEQASIRKVFDGNRFAVLKDFQAESIAAQKIFVFRQGSSLLRRNSFVPRYGQKGMGRDKYRVDKEL